MVGYIVTISILAGLFTFYMGYVDGTSAIASSIATNALKPRSALITSALSMFVAPIIIVLLMKSDSVARTVGSLIYTDSYLTINQTQGFVFLLSAMLGALIWAVISTILSVPNSVSHILLGGIVGAGIAMFGINAVDWNSVGIKVILMVFLAPILGLIVGYLMQLLFVFICQSWPRAMKKGFRVMQRINVVLLSISIAANNIQKSLGIYLLAAVLCSNNAVSFDTYQFSWWIIIVFSVLQCLGLFFGGEKLISTVGYKIHRLSNVQSFVAQLSTLIISFFATFLGLPIATTQVVSSTIMGVGAAENFTSVRWIRAKKIFISWIVTFPASLLLGYVICIVLKAILI